MDFSTAVKTCFSKYADFTGRAQRSEYWYFFLFSFLVQSLIDLVLNSDSASGLASLALLVPSLSAGARRLHDTGRSGWWQLLILIPILGWIILLVFYVKEGDAGENDYGYDPLDRSADPHERARYEMDAAKDATRDVDEDVEEARYASSDAAGVEETSDEDNPWVKVRKKNAKAAKSKASKPKTTKSKDAAAKKQAKKKITEEKKPRIEPPKFGRDAAKKDKE